MTTIGGDGSLEVDLLEYGARIHAIRVPLPGGGRRNIVLSLPGLEEYETTEGFHGATVGRYANRIAGGSFTLDAHTYQLPVNDRGNTLHGGPDGFDRRWWTTVDRGPWHLELLLVSLDGDQGFPGTLTVRARFEVDGMDLRTTYVATTDAPTPVSLSSHTYYNLDGSDRVDDHTLQVVADHWTAVDGTGIPQGGMRDVRDTPFDLRCGARLGSVVHARHPQIRAAAGLDHNFVLRGSGMRPAAVLQGGGLRLELHTDQRGLQVYTGAERWPGIALEPQAFPDSPNRPHWPSTVLRPGELYTWSSVVRMSSTERPPADAEEM